jgi:MFS family permease
MIIRKLYIIIMGIFLVICAGSCYIYPLYLKLLMDKFKFTLREVNFFGSSINLGLWLAFPMGYINDKYGPKVSCIIGAISLSGTYILLYLIMTSKLTSFPIYLLILLGFIMGQGSSLCYTCALTTNLKNFKFRDSSSIVGLLVANLAISPSIFTTYREFFSEYPISQYFLVISAFVGVVILLCGFIFTNMPNIYSEEEKIKSYEKYKEKKYISMLITINIISFILFLFGVIFNNFTSDNKFPNVFIFPFLQSINFIVIIFEYLGVLDRFYFKNFIDRQIKTECNSGDNLVSERTKKISNDPSNEPEKFKENYTSNKTPTPTNIIKENLLDINSKLAFENLLSEKRSDNSAIFMKKESNKEHINTIEMNLEMRQKGENDIIPDKLSNDSAMIMSESEHSVSLHSAIFSKKISILFVMLVFGIGSMIANLNNIEFIVKSIVINQSPKDIYEYVILYFAFNSFTRIISGIYLDKLLKKGKIYQFLILISFGGLLSQILGLVLHKNVLYISISLAGLTHGGYMTFTPVFVRTEFGTENMGKILGVLTSGCAIGSLIMADFTFTIFYDINKVNARCFGKSCYFYSYLISSLLMVLNCMLAIYMYKNDIKHIPYIKEKEEKIIPEKDSK